MSFSCFCCAILENQSHTSHFNIRLQSGSDLFRLQRENMEVKVGEIWGYAEDILTPPFRRNVALTCWLCEGVHHHEVTSIWCFFARFYGISWRNVDERYAAAGYSLTIWFLAIRLMQFLLNLSWTGLTACSELWNFEVTLIAAFCSTHSTQ
jgi:hypothetical protein